MTVTPMIDRAFLRLEEGLVHYRHAGQGLNPTPLYLAHGGPGSSRAWEPLLPLLGRERWTIAPDMLGNGDSAAPAPQEPDIAYYADCVVRILDRLGIERIDFMGTHTGALIGIELSRRHGDRLRQLVLDGVLLLNPAKRARMQERYAPRVWPDDHGGYLAWAYQFCRDMMLFYPYFERTADHATGNGVPPAAILHPLVVEVLKALTTYHCGYHAAFAYDAAEQLAKVSHPTLLTSNPRDPLHVDLQRTAALLPTAEVHMHPAGTGPVEIASRIDRFLRQDAGAASP